ncbi:MAG: trypsin-like peptidase domain-containing protein [Clostridiales bacterium]|nr:trypsin-like peptidase domain-containing protein [Clostridiales bacterium]
MREYDNDFRSEFFNERIESAACETTGGAMGELAAATTPEAGRRSAGQYVLTKKRIAVMLIFCVIISGFLGTGSAYLTSKAIGNGSYTSWQLSAQPELFRPAAADTSPDADGRLSVQQIIEKAADAVVEISTESVANDIWMRQYITQGAGSGVIVSSDGYIMTNNHVIRGSGKINVTLRNGETYEARLIGSDQQTDVAVVKIEASNLTPVVFGDSDSIVIGELAVAIGNPLGQLGGTVTSGIISSLDRELTIENKNMTLLQTDASINPGNSGGGLFNQHGEMIGLVVAKSAGSGVEGLGFAIPVNTAKTVAAQLIENGYVKGRPFIGIQMRDLTSAQDAIFYGVRNLGVYVDKVISDGARKAGFQEGDMLYYIEDTRIEAPSDLTDALQKYKVGDTVTITVVRDNQLIELTVVLGEQKSE